MFITQISSVPNLQVLVTLFAQMKQIGLIHSLLSHSKSVRDTVRIFRFDLYLYLLIELG